MEMLYNLITSLPMMVCTFFSVLLLLGWRDTQLREQHSLLGYMLAATLLYTGHYAFFNHATPILPFMDAVYVTTNLAVYPLYLIYIIRLTREWRPVYWWLLLPAVVGGVAASTAYVLMSEEEHLLFTDSFLYHNQTAGLTGVALWQAWIHIACKLVFALEVIITLVAGTRLIRRFDRQVDEFYADTDERSLRSIQTILILVLIISALSFVANIVGRYRFTGSVWLLAIPSLAFSALLFAIGHVGMKRHYSIIDLLNDQSAVLADADGKSLSRLGSKTLSERIVEMVEARKIYLQPDLKLEDLARLLHTNRTYIYLAFTQEMGMTFNEFINRRRIRHATELKALHPEWSTSDIATQSGFASLSSFYRNLNKFK